MAPFDQLSAGHSLAERARGTAAAGAHLVGANCVRERNGNVSMGAPHLRLRTLHAEIRRGQLPIDNSRDYS